MEQRIGYSRLANHVLPFNYGNNVMNQLGVPGINVDADSSGMSLFNVSGFQALGDSGSIPIINYNNIYQYALTMTKVHDHHTFIGARPHRPAHDAVPERFPKGSFSFDSNPTSNGAGSGGNSVASLLAGYPSSTSRSKTLYWPDFHGGEYGFYIQDDWRVSRKLTLNLGLRYDIITPLVRGSRPGLQPRFRRELRCSRVRRRSHCQPDHEERRRADRFQRLLAASRLRRHPHSQDRAPRRLRNQLLPPGQRQQPGDAQRKLRKHAELHDHSQYCEQPAI